MGRSLVSSGLPYHFTSESLNNEGFPRYFQQRTVEHVYQTLHRAPGCVTGMISRLDVPLVKMTKADVYCAVLLNLAGRAQTLPKQTTESLLLPWMAAGDVPLCSSPCHFGQVETYCLRTYWLGVRAA